MRPPAIRTPEELETALRADLFLLFKHSHRCGISTRAFAAYEAWFANGAGVPTGWIDVLGDRPLSLDAARRTGVAHASPQVVLLRAGQACWNSSHFAITTEAIENAVRDAS